MSSKEWRANQLSWSAIYLVLAMSNCVKAVYASLSSMKNNALSSECSLGTKLHVTCAMCVTSSQASELDTWFLKHVFRNLCTFLCNYYLKNSRENDAFVNHPKWKPLWKKRSCLTLCHCLTVFFGHKQLPCMHARLHQLLWLKREYAIHS